MKNTYESWVRSFVENLANYFDLAGWTIRVDFSDQDKSGTYAENDIHSQYLFSAITFYKQSRLDYEAGIMDHLINAVVHEMVHILLNPFHHFVDPYLSATTEPFFVTTLEHQTQRLTRIFLKSLPKSVIPPR